MSTYTIISVNYTYEMDLLQVKASNHTEALNEWATTLVNNEFIEGIEGYQLKELVENEIHEDKYCDNVWRAFFTIQNEWYAISIIKTSEESDLVYDTEIITQYILSQLEEENEKINPKDIKLILELSFNYLKDAGTVKTNQDGDYVESYQFNEELETDRIKYINLELLKRQKPYSNELIEEVMDLEYEYMENNGFIIEGKVYYSGLEFDMPSEN